MQPKPAANHSTSKPSPSVDSSKKQLCGLCSSRDKKEFNAEVAIHFTGLKGLSKPIVWVFPKLSVCLNCGATAFAIPERELRVLRGENAEGALIWPEVA